MTTRLATCRTCQSFLELDPVRLLTASLFYSGIAYQPPSALNLSVVPIEALSPA